MSLDSPGFKKMINLIRDSFRVRKNHNPIYVDVGGHLERIRAEQHQVIFGRRGSGKSCLFIHYLTNPGEDKIVPVYILADEYKRLTYPDILIRLLIEVLEAIPVRWKHLKKITFRQIPTIHYAQELRKLLDMADERNVVEDHKEQKTQSAHATIKTHGVGTGANVSEDVSHGRTMSFREWKLDTLERHLRDYKDAIISTMEQWPNKTASILIDDFYLIPRDRHPDVLDYLHRLFRDTALYLKISTIRHRTNLIRNHPMTIGVELSQDVEEISLDRTLEDIQATQDFLWRMLESIGEKAGVKDLADHFNPDSLLALTLASGGVPRDFLTIFIHAVEASCTAGKTQWLTPTFIYKGGGRETYQTKLKNLREDAGKDVGGIERVFVDLLSFCLKEKKKTAFLISQDEAQQHAKAHDVINQLMDFKLIHVVEPNTSAASRRQGRFEAYTLDFSLFKEPRRRNIETTEFWKVDSQYRRMGIREAPVYSLERASNAYDNETGLNDPGEILDETEEVAIPDAPESHQHELFEDTNKN